MKKKIRILKVMSYIALAGIFTAALALSYAPRQYRNTILVSSLAAVLPFLFLQYIIFIQHCRSEYLGVHRLRWLIILIAEPAGFARFIYFRDHIRAYMRSSGRYAYTSDPVSRRIGDLSVNVIMPDKNSPGGVRTRVMPIVKSPVYRFLLDEDREEFDRYHQVAVRKKRPGYRYSVSRFKKLLKNIKINGYKKCEPYIKVKGNTISDGQHRACVIYYLYGPDFEVDVVLNRNFM